MTASFDRLTAIPAHDLRPHADAFTTWLAQHPDDLADALGDSLDLRQVAPGALVGSIAGSPRPVVVVTALDESTDDLLGRLLGLTATHDAGLLVWVGPHLSATHRQALRWLDARPDTRAVGVEVTFVRIGDSSTAPRLRTVTATAPLDHADPTPDPLAYADFWEACRDRIGTEHPRWTRTRTVPHDDVFTTSTGLPGLSLQMVAEPKGPQLRLLIDGPDPDVNAERFRRLSAAREVFETTVDAPLAWRHPDEVHRDGRATAPGVVTRTEHLVDLRDTGTWPAMVSWLISRQREFRAALERTGPTVLSSASS